MSQVTDYISTLSLPYRGDCPACYNKNTFSANLIGNIIVYYCFHTSCKLRGRIKHEITVEQIKEKPLEKEEEPYVLPTHFSNPLQNKLCLSFLRRNNLLDIYGEGELEVYYDPIQQRCVFPLRNFEKELKGATGRALVRGQFPKWRHYVRNSYCPYIMARIQTKGCVLVEDPISAIIGSVVNDCISILGTSISIRILPYITRYSELYISLDDDATSKAIELQHKLSLYKPTKIIPLRKDLKYFTKKELEEWYKENILC